MRNQINTVAHRFTADFTRTSDRVLDTVVDANRTAVDVAVKTIDAVTDAIELPALPVEVPFADRIEVPTPAQAGHRYLDFVERAADMNRDFNQRLVGMLDLQDAANTTAAKTTTAKKATARKAAAKK